MMRLVVGLDIYSKYVGGVVVLVRSWWSGGATMEGSNKATQRSCGGAATVCSCSASAPTMSERATSLHAWYCCSGCALLYVQLATTKLYWRSLLRTRGCAQRSVWWGADGLDESSTARF
jgi:hypothetical protein